MSVPRTKLRSSAKGSQQKAQAKEIVVNTRGWVLKEPFPDHKLFEKITAISWSSTNLKAGIKKQRSKNPADPVFRPETPDFRITDREKADPRNENETRYRIVGYTFPELPVEYSNKVPEWSKKAGGMGMELPADGNIIPWGNFEGSTESPPVIVVSPMFDQAPEQTRYVALICPKDGLCHPYSVRVGEVFFRAEYRDGSTSNRERDINWAARVATACGSLVSPNAVDQPGKARISKKATGGAKLQVPPIQSLINELTSHVAAL